MTRLLVAALVAALLPAATPPPTRPPRWTSASPAPAFKIKDASGKVIDLAELTAKGPVLVRLTCGCSGCDKELAYFQKLSRGVQGPGPRQPVRVQGARRKMAKYAADKKLDVLYAVDPKGESWTVFQTKSMPTNFLIDKGGKIVAIATGCEPGGLVAEAVSGKAAKLLGTDKVDVKADKKK